MISAKKGENCIRWLCALSMVLCWACVKPDGPGTPLGTLHIDYGSDVYVNKGKGHEGMTIYSGDNVVTWDGTIVYVNFPDGGFVQLDQKTDPDFRKWFEHGKCIIGAFFRFGRAYGETGSDCDILVNDRHLEAVARTKFNIETDDHRSILTVIQGIMLLRMQGSEVPVHASQQVVISRNRVKEVRTLSPEELREVTIWRHEYVRLGWCCADRKVFQSDPDECSRRGGFFSYDERIVRSRCQPPEPSGFCCQDGRVFESSRDECIRRGGSFFRTGEEAERQCRPPVRLGWCCADRNVFQSDPDECRRRGGFFSYDERIVRSRCQPPEPSGFCCQDGRVFESDRDECIRRRGAFFSTYNEARRKCQPGIE